MSEFGKFYNFCRDSTLPICNLFALSSSDPEPLAKSCVLVGLQVNDNRVANLGSVILSGIAIIMSIYLLWRSEKKQAAVGRREMQLFILSYIILSIAEIFSIGGFLTNPVILKWFSAIHVAAITTTCWLLLLNAVVGYQILDDGTLISISLFVISALMIFIGTGYIGLDVAFGYTEGFVPDEDYKNYALYVLYLLFPLVCLVGYFILETILVLRVLGETRPMLILGLSVLLFSIGKIFTFVVSVHICKGVDGKIDGSLFETLFNLLAVGTLWSFWSSITEDTWMDEPLNPAMSDVGYDTHRSGYNSQYP